MTEEAEQEPIDDSQSARDAAAMRAERIARRGAANPRSVPDYTRLRPCEATSEELALVGTSSVSEFVDQMNRALLDRGLLPITQFDYPTTRKRLVKLLERWSRLVRQ
ncbi:hypothetical protein HFO56_00115 [Rhizobium laguerreae]|uniref:hypothetical protein n=1 Tax=Rhizobium laguerreae TaxID=1076926 RepID=UPI001C900CF4|nr:hypothetical protein [Rhizobium laguerreae]MBY3150832.1 hypothetical protein [Rhizobium laguerreae]